MKRFPVWWVENGKCACGASHVDENGNVKGSPGKHPITKNGVKDASNDPQVIAAWQKKWPKANWGIATGAGLLVVDLDVKPDKDGRKTLAGLGTVPPTLVVRTGSGGLHVYLSTTKELPNTAGKLGPGVDTRCTGGYVLAAGSNHISGGEYVVLHDAPIAPCPQWLEEKLTAAMTTEHPRAIQRVFPPASAEVLQAARRALDEHGPAIQGDGGDTHTMMAAAILTHDFALTDEEAWPLLEEWNKTCEPQWSKASLFEKLVNGRKYGKAEYGCKRKVEALALTDKLIADWRAAGENREAIPKLIESVRDIFAHGQVLPSEKALIEQTLEEATGVGPRAQALPKAFARAVVIAGQGNESGFDIGANGQPVMNLNNVVIVLEQKNAPLRFDTFLQRIINGEGKEWTDDQTRALTLHIQREVGLSRMPSSVVGEAVATYAYRHKTNCVVDYLRSHKWDGKKRIQAFLVNAFGTTPSEYILAASTNFWRSLVARPLRPGCKVDTMIVLEGEQGIFKSSALKAIAGEWFAEAAESPLSKDFFQSLTGKLIVEIAELDSFSRADINAVKRVLSCFQDRFRVPYAELTQDFPRQGIFAGTTNKSDWNRDETGARRFWPVFCTRVDMDFIRSNRDQLFAEAVSDFDAGKPWWVMPQKETLAEQEKRFQQDPWEEILGEHIAKSESSVFRVVDLLADPLGVENARMGKADQMRLGAILKRLGLKKTTAWHEGKVQKLWKK